MQNSYRQYFDIDPDYFPAVNADIIKNNPGLWKKYFPHSTFVRLLKEVVNVLSRTKKLNIWVEGAYGTGKSHAALTLKHLLDAPAEEVKAYFEDFKIDNDLCQRFLNVKSQGRIITVHRYASSSIHGDNDLFLAIQESIEAALKEAGIDNQGGESLRDSVVRYLSDEENKESFGVYVRGSYAELFGGDSVDQIIANLQSYNGDALQSLMGKIYKVAHEKQIKAFILNSDDLCQWIKSVIEDNGLWAIVFIWDEFTEYFKNNRHCLTGFQEVLEKSATAPFCFIPVTHQSNALFTDAEAKTKNKILDRFVKPTCLIELPENMAFQLMGQAMKKASDPATAAEWERALDDLRSRTEDSRHLVAEMAGVSDDDLNGILPIHPYAAVLLKHISTSFASNQRSMFDFIKNDQGDEQKGFQWFIDNYSDMSENPFLTIDMLWGFFYERGRDNLTQSIKQILDNYPLLEAKKLNSNEKRVLKVILLLQAMSLEVNDSVELFIPKEKNINLAFEGTDIDGGAAGRCAEKLVRDNIIFKRKIGNGQEQYSILTGDMDSGKIESLKKNFVETSTSKLIAEGDLGDSIELPEALKRRCLLAHVGLTDFEKEAKRAATQSAEDCRHIYCIAAYSRDDNESALMAQRIKQFMAQNPDCEIVIIDCGRTVMSEQQFADWVINKASSSYYTGKDNGLAQQYNTYAVNILNEWRTRIKNGQFVVYTQTTPNGDTMATAEAMVDAIKQVNRRRFPCALEQYSINASLWGASALKQGVECGVNQQVSGQYRTSVAQNKLETVLAGAWQVDSYWETSPSLPVSKMKVAVDELINKTIDRDGRISIRALYDLLTNKPFGFMACNVSAFFIGFLMKEYVKGGTLTWSDGLSTDELTIDKFKEMVDEVIKNDITANPRYRDKYLVAMTPEEKSFLETTIEAFQISRSLCSSVEQARERIRTAMKEQGFPLWTLGEVVSDVLPEADDVVIKQIIDLYCKLANNDSSASGKTDSDLAMEIGRTCLGKAEMGQQLHKLISKDNCTNGMQKYLGSYNEGLLPKLAHQIDDGGQYINELRKKFDADAANWVWRKETVDKKIDELILEYQIAEATCGVLEKVHSYDAAIHVWIDKCGRLRLPYQVLKDEVGVAAELFGLLCPVVRDRRIDDSKKADFVAAINQYGREFVDVHNNQQLTIFRRAMDFYLAGLDNSNVAEIFHQLPTNTYNLDKADFATRLTSIVTEYKQKMGSQKMKALWKDKTGTDTPYAWSKLYKMPILAMFDAEHEAEARRAFDIINAPNSDSNSVEQAIAYLEAATFYADLADAAKRDKAFVSKVLGNYSVVLTDIEEVKSYLSDHITDAPYYWHNSSQVKEQLRKFAESRYNTIGHQRAAQKIDGMMAEDVKRYLKELIKNNMTVGIEIIRNN